MEIDTITGRVHVHDRQQLASVLCESRQGAFGAFTLGHQQPYPWLSVHINGSLAYLHYFPAEGHPGFQSQASAVPSSASADKMVHFLHSPDGGDSFDIPLSTTVSAELAFLAAHQFFAVPTLPTCIRWGEL